MGTRRRAPRGGGGAAQRSSAHALASRSNADKLALWLLQVLLVTLSKSLASVGSMGGRWFAWQLWCGRSTLHLAAWLRTLLLHTVAWLWQPAGPRSAWPQRWARAFGAEAIRRVHVLLGEFARAAASLRPYGPRPPQTGDARVHRRPSGGARGRGAPRMGRGRGGGRTRQR